MQPKYKVGDLVMCESTSGDPYEIVEAMWNPYFACWTYNAKSLDSLLLGATEMSLAPWNAAPATPTPRACDCGGHKARTTHSSWCSYLSA